MNLTFYDFDHTIYDGDSTVAFFLYCLKKRPGLLRYLPRQLYHAFLYGIGKENTTVFKGQFFSFLQGVPDTDTLVTSFWHEHGARIKQWYIDQVSADDIIISASPEFLLQPIAKRYGARLIATRVNVATGAIEGKNCRGAEKVVRLREDFPDATIVAAYTDDLKADGPMLAIAQESYHVVKNTVTKL